MRKSPLISSSFAALVAMNHIWQTSPWDTLNVHLFTNDFVPGPNSVIGDFVEPLSTWYAPWSSTGLNGAVFLKGLAVYNEVSAVFTSDGSLPGAIAYGFFLTDTNGAYVGGCRFDDGPYALINDQDCIICSLNVNLSGGFSTLDFPS